jgi:hypothetical protein
MLLIWGHCQHKGVVLHAAAGAASDEQLAVCRSKAEEVLAVAAACQASRQAARAAAAMGAVGKMLTSLLMPSWCWPIMAAGGSDGGDDGGGSKEVGEIGVGALGGKATEAGGRH